MHVTGSSFLVWCLNTFVPRLPEGILKCWLGAGVGGSCLPRRCGRVRAGMQKGGSEGLKSRKVIVDRGAVLPLTEEQTLRTGAGAGWGVSYGFGPRRGSKTEI